MQSHTRLFSAWVAEQNCCRQHAQGPRFCCSATVSGYSRAAWGAKGLKSIELHVGAQTEHGDVATVFYKTAFANGSQVSQGRVAACTLTSDDLIGPSVLPLGERLDTSVVFDR